MLPIPGEMDRREREEDGTRYGSGVRVVLKIPKTIKIISLLLQRKSEYFHKFKDPITLVKCYCRRGKLFSK